MISSVDVEKAFNKFQNLFVTLQTALGKLAMGGKITNVLKFQRNLKVNFTLSGEAVVRCLQELNQVRAAPTSWLLPDTVLEVLANR